MQDPCTQTHIGEVVDSLLSSVLTGEIAVVGDNNFIRIVADEPCLVRCYCCAESGDHVAEASLINCDNVHIAFTEYQLFCVSIFSEIHGEEIASLVENGSCAGIEIFRF